MVIFFLQVSWEKSYLKSSTLRMYETDMAKVFNINVTNTIDGGASSCLPCPQVSVLVAALLLRDEITHPLSICAFSKSCFRSGCDTSKLNYFKLDSTIL